MKISTKGRYALRVMTDLAINYSDNCVSLNEIATRQQISMKYLESIISMLHKAGFVDSQRGKSGGYRLSKKPAEYTIADILLATEGSLAPVACLDADACPRANKCLTLPMWKGLEEVIYDYLSKYTIEDLIDQDFNI